jgi:HAD superfamily hydrolase (TIGR01509 family)
VSSTYAGQRDDLPDAVLFDMDGLLVDTEPQWYAAETATVHQLGGVWGKQQQVDLLGSNLEYAAEYMREHTSTAFDADSIQSMLLDNMTAELAKGVTFRPGVGSLLASLTEAGVPLSLVTSSVKVHAKMVLARLPMTNQGAGRTFEHVVTADDVTNLKPHPEPYLRVLDLMAVRPERTVALEDSPNGMMSATAAGCLVVGVPSVVPLEAGPRQTVVNSIDEVTLPMLLELLTRS